MKNYVNQLQKPAIVLGNSIRVRPWKQTFGLIGAFYSTDAADPEPGFLLPI
jgi:hypothetical protein